MGDSGSGSSSSRQAACLACRRTKTKCHRELGDATCRRCRQKGDECVITSHHIGRQKGTKNKRTGLDKVIYQVEQCIQQMKAGISADETDPQLLHLRDADTFFDVGEYLSTSSDAHVESQLPQDDAASEISSLGSHTPGPTPVDFPLNDAENPLQLLAHASDLSRSRLTQQDVNRNNDAGQGFFRPLKPKLDVGPDMDPIELGLVTQAEAEELFEYFYTHLAHTRWGLDRSIHTLSFVQGRSSFLFVSILAAAALFIPSADAISKRLSAHCRTLAHKAMVERYRSVEVVLAFMVNVPWLSFGEHIADDETCAYLASALTIAIDLSLHKTVNPSPNNTFNANLQRGSGSDCIDAKKALALDGFESVEPSSAIGRKLLRRRERTWLSLFVLDRGVCLARGRVPVVPVTFLVQRCDTWHISDIADVWDSSIVSIAVMRRDLDVLITSIKLSCDTFIPGVNSSSDTVERIKITIENFFNQWHRIWAYAQQPTPSYALPPYVQILVSHTRLSTYSSVINHPTASPPVRRFFRAAGLAAALNVMRAAVRGEKELASMPNNTAIMVAFAACFTLRLCALGVGVSVGLKGSVRRLVEETAGALERIGGTGEGVGRRRGVAGLLGGRIWGVLGRGGGRGGDVLRVTRTEKRAPDGRETDFLSSGWGTEVREWVPAPRAEPPSLLFSAMADWEIDAAVQSDLMELRSGEGDSEGEGELGLEMPVGGPDRLDWMDWLDWSYMCSS
ncbi:uncharacterized protein K452DRAFT_220757 [Aplosporella prunicola CBS 121167]|uniref:Zn(2)-C6 fungal-type domain-containing protein n=1 Tax=Aplosporella prunicola CBS 121167 TaxID=1176127 RepID=A0A6A6BNY8_9PEZI|nr:uncharacterized protein K452DRAFT_220757 [Aplosporella prunicola CBS 121167]KAF2145859.1 hypothetical protein K452DRAFT_220757 [Aplosporella prunicola CBS 121167]